MIVFAWTLSFEPDVCLNETGIGAIRTASHGPFTSNSTGASAYGPSACLGVGSPTSYCSFSAKTAKTITWFRSSKLRLLKAPVEFYLRHPFQFLFPHLWFRNLFRHYNLVWLWETPFLIRFSNIQTAIAIRQGKSSRHILGDYWKRNLHLVAISRTLVMRLLQPPPPFFLGSQQATESTPAYRCQTDISNMLHFFLCFKFD